MRVVQMEGVRRYPATRSEDERGSFSELVANAVGRPVSWRRYASAVNTRTGTLRGLHYHRTAPSPKVVCCTAGSVFDVLVDLRTTIAHRDWMGVTLASGDALYIPAGIAHGYVTLTDATSLLYMLAGEAADDGGVRWNDPVIAVEWPIEPVVMSVRDRKWPNL